MHLSKFGIFKTRAPKSFDYTPRYYNKSRERLKERESEIRKEMELGAEHRITSNRNVIRTEQWSRNHIKHQNRNSRARLLVILAVMGILLFLMYGKLDIF